MFSFKDIIGQEPAKQRLIQEVQEGRIPHAQLFCGPAGVGKLPLALAYARYICCPNRTETDACGTCPSCVKWNKLVHPDVHFVYPIVKSAKGKKEVCDDYIANWRHLLLNSPYFGLNHWLNEMDAENGQAIIYAKEKRRDNPQAQSEIQRRRLQSHHRMAARKNARSLRQQAAEAAGRAARENDIPPHFRSSGNDTAHHPQPHATLQHPQD